MNLTYENNYSGYINAYSFQSLHHGTNRQENIRQYPQSPARKATVAFIGTFYISRGSSQSYGEGKRRWRLIKGFKIEDDIEGNIKVKEIEIDPNLSNDSTNNQFAATELIIGERYVVLLNPSSEKLEYIIDNQIPFDYYNHLITKEEIITVVKVK
jgi:hypothetical protein